jgi:outer membrane receptor protein involved in Fe transport
MSLHIAKLALVHSLALASAAIFLHIGSASAAHPAKDIQQQMQELLAGTAAASSASPSGVRGGQGTARAVDSQELVREVLSGKTASSGTESRRHSSIAANSVKAQPRGFTYRDSQAAMRHVLLGQSHARDAS